MPNGYQDMKQVRNGADRIKNSPDPASRIKDRR